MQVVGLQLVVEKKFKLTQRHSNNWEANILFFQCMIFPTIDLGMDEFTIVFQMTNDTM
jgi:hypothetical protein